MTQVTPPGWYPDPGQTSDGPASERWWDGKAWTDRTRSAGSAAVWGPPAQTPEAGDAPDPGAVPSPDVTPETDATQQVGPYPAYPGYPDYSGYPAYPGQPPAAGRRGMRTGIAVGAATAVLAGIGVGVWALSGSDSSSGTAGQQQGQDGFGGQQGGPSGFPSGIPSGGPEGQGQPPGGDGGSGGASPSPQESEAPKVESGSVNDSVSGISIPIPDDWYGQQIQVGAQVTSNDSYECPGDTSKSCTKGGAYSVPASALGYADETVEEIAKADISENAEESYGGTTYGSITSHEVLASKAVTVAGQKGYLVRWKAVTSKGADGYVESLAFPSPSNSDQIVVMRFGVDTDQEQSVIDDITKGIKVSTDSGSGSGQDV